MDYKSALQILDQATQPRSQERMTRQDYVLVQQALELLNKLVMDLESEEKAKGSHRE